MQGQAPDSESTFLYEEIYGTCVEDKRNRDEDMHVLMVSPVRGVKRSTKIELRQIKKKAEAVYETNADTHGHKAHIDSGPLDCASQIRKDDTRHEIGPAGAVAPEKDRIGLYNEVNWTLY